MMNLQCPHCGSVRGYYTLNNFKDVPVFFGFDGSVKEIKVNEKEGCRRKDAYCISCKKIISTARDLELRIRSQKEQNPIAKFRKMSGYTQGELAELLGCSRSSVAQWELRNSAPRKKLFIKRMSRLFNHPEFMKEFCEFYDIR